MTDSKKMLVEHKDKRILIAFHGHCIDGFTSAWVVYNEMKHRGIQEKNIESSPMHHKPEQKDSLLATVKTGGYDVLYIVDFSFPIEVLRELAGYTKVIMLDHHKSAFESLDPGCKVHLESTFDIEEPNLWVILNMAESGASLCWKHFNPITTVFPPLVAFVKDYDLWQFKYPETKVMNKYIRLRPKNFTSYSTLHQKLLEPSARIGILSQAYAIQQYHDTLIEEIIATCMMTIDINGHKGLVVNAPHSLSSDLGHELAVRSGTYGAVWLEERDGITTFSLRSNGDYDVSTIAVAFGGGGHRNAAGFSIATSGYDPEKGIQLWSVPDARVDTIEEEGTSYA